MKEKYFADALIKRLEKNPYNHNPMKADAAGTIVILAGIFLIRKYAVIG